MLHKSEKRTFEGLKEVQTAQAMMMESLLQKLLSVKDQMLKEIEESNHRLKAFESKILQDFQSY
jgi:hypothetical protein